MNRLASFVVLLVVGVVAVGSFVPMSVALSAAYEWTWFLLAYAVVVALFAALRSGA